MKRLVLIKWLYRVRLRVFEVVILMTRKLSRQVFLESPCSQSTCLIFRVRTKSIHLTRLYINTQL